MPKSPQELMAAIMRNLVAATARSEDHAQGEASWAGRVDDELRGWLRSACEEAAGV